MWTFLVAAALIASATAACADDKPASTIDNITKSARDMLHDAIPSIGIVVLDARSQHAGFLGCLEQNDDRVQLIHAANGSRSPGLGADGCEVSTFKVTWGLPPKARLLLKSTGIASLQKLEEIAAKGSSGNGMLVSALISSAVATKRVQSTMRLSTAFLDVNFGS